MHCIAGEGAAVGIAGGGSLLCTSSVAATCCALGAEGTTTCSGWLFKSFSVMDAASIADNLHSGQGTSASEAASLFESLDAFVVEHVSASKVDQIAFH